MTCHLCEKVPFYKGGDFLYCKDHKQYAERQQAIASRRVDRRMAILEDDLDRIDKERRYNDKSKKKGRTLCSK